MLWGLWRGNGPREKRKKDVSWGAIGWWGRVGRKDVRRDCVIVRIGS